MDISARPSPRRTARCAASLLPSAEWVLNYPLQRSLYARCSQSIQYWRWRLRTTRRDPRAPPSLAQDTPRLPLACITGSRGVTARGSFGGGTLGTKIKTKRRRRRRWMESESNEVEGGNVAYRCIAQARAHAQLFPLPCVPHPRRGCPFRAPSVHDAANIDPKDVHAR